ncbi:MAG TPA: 1-(5-phosphoribosyl)-5-[(5-phosphoribosylamino)methylideneamino]imidazole-4-carboxamide isomerase [Dehalococcoidia bacterium]|nr:1-(5-phosphoribosyl)-5-[(5-phosphoribosylamino)methylideneamino]imidazole-4-carboxamide isomerase [Dehalococcoidia bacterium]
MDVIPAIDIRGGRCVRLVQGDYARETVFADDPAEAAKRWRDAGARRLHVVDLDGARQGRPLNWEAVTRIVAAVDAPVQMGGGLRDLGTVQRYLDGGIERVVLGTAAVKDEALLGAALDRFPGRIVVGVDARDGIVVTEGWLEASGVAAGELVRRLAAMGVPRIIYTDTLRDGTLTEPNFPGLQALLADVQSSGGEMRVLYSGGVASLRHVRRLAETGVEGVVVGRALYTGDIDLREALAAVEA